MALLAAAVILLTVALPARAHDRKEHDAGLEYVLFDKNDEYRKAHPKVADMLKALEDAVYLTVDQYNGHGSEQLEFLKSMGVKGLPDSIDDFNFSANDLTHRLLTHRGWNFEYPEKSHWSIRQKILKKTVQRILFENEKQPLSWLPWLSEILYGTSEEPKQRDSFCALLYYVHILGDHIAAEKYTQLADIAPLVRPNDKENPGLIPELQKYLDILFSSQHSSYTYYALMGELDALNAKAEKLVSSTGGINTDEKFSQYHQLAEDLKELLSYYLHTLLMNEPFFADHFK